MPLTVFESVIYVALLAHVREQLKKGDMIIGATVQELSKKLSRPISSVRAALNGVAKAGLVVAESPGAALLLTQGRSAKEKIWRPAHKLDDEEIKKVLNEHPEIVSNIGKEILEKYLGIKLD